MRLKLKFLTGINYFTSMRFQIVWLYFQHFVHDKPHDLLQPCRNYQVISYNYKNHENNDKNNITLQIINNYKSYFFIFIFMSIFILLTRRKATEALIRRVGNYPDLLPEMPRYCCPLVI